jgi:hypothetical protein
MTRYILNSAVVTTPGTYRYELIDADGARAWLAAGSFDSRIGYQETADALAAITRREIRMDRTLVTMQSGDEALVFRLVLPPGTARIRPGDKGRLTPEYVLRHCEIGLLRRVE